MYSFNIRSEIWRRFPNKAYKLWICASLNPAHSNCQNLWQWFFLEIRLKAFHWSTIPAKQFIMTPSDIPLKFKTSTLETMITVSPATRCFLGIPISCMPKLWSLCANGMVIRKTLSKHFFILRMSRTLEKELPSKDAT